MSDDPRPPPGAVAPRGARAIRSTRVLDAIWVVVAGIAFVATSFAPLADVAGGAITTGDAPLRVAAVFASSAAAIVAVASAVAGSERGLAAATGALVAPASVVGVTSASLFLDRRAAYADVGVALSLVASLFAVVAIVRWFTYHPVSWRPGERRPVRRASWSLAALAAAVAAAVLATAVLDAGATTAQFAVAVAFALLPPVAVVAGALVRTSASVAFALSAALTTSVTVVALRADGEGISLGSPSTLWIGPVALVALVVAVATAVAGLAVRSVDDVSATADDDRAWRWDAPD